MATYSTQCSSVGNFSYANRFTLYVVLSNRDGDPSTNHSIIDYNVYFQNTSGGGTFTSQTRLYFRLNGIVLRDETLSVTGPRNGSVSIASGSMTVPHNDDGSQMVTFQALVQSTNYGILGNIQDAFTLTTIPRKSLISCSTANIGTNATITISSASSTFIHNVYGAFGNQSFSIASNMVGGSFEWKIPTSFYSEIPNARIGEGIIMCETWNNGTLVGTNSRKFYVTTDESVCRPTVSGTIKDINPVTLALTGNENKLIKNVSTAQIDVSPSSKNSASIKTVKIDGVTVTNNQRIIEKVTKATFPIEVIDTRDYPNNPYSVVAKDGIIDYVDLTLSATFFRPQPTTGEIQLTYSGNYFEGNFGTVDNRLEIKWSYREKGSEKWIEGGTLFPKILENKISEETISLGETYDYQKEYEFQIIAKDKLTIITRMATVSMGTPVFNWGKDFFNVNVKATFEEGIKSQYIPIANSPLIDSFNEINNSENLNNSGLYTVALNNHAWYNLLNLRHRNGYGDGIYYGLQIRNAMLDTRAKLEVRQQYAGDWGGWRTLQEEGIVLYENASGTTGTVTLSESAANFKYLEIYVLSTSDSSTGYAQNSTKVFNPNGKSAWLTSGYCYANDYNLKICSALISGTQITRPYGSWEFATEKQDNTNYIGITKVVGYY